MTEQMQRPLSAAQIKRSLANATEPRRDASGLGGDSFPANEDEAAGIVVEWLHQAGLLDAVEDRMLSGSDEVAIARTMVSYLVLKSTGGAQRFVFPSVETMVEEMGDRVVSFTASQDGEQMVVQIELPVDADGE